MKTVKKKDVIKRVTDLLAIKMTTDQGWIYVPKSEWKNHVRDAKDVKNEKVEPIVKTKDKDKKNKNRSKSKQKS